MILARLIVLSVLLFTFSCSPETDDGKIYYAIEINGVLCGYTETSESHTSVDGKEYLNQTVDMYIMLSLFGSEFNTDMKIMSVLDPDSKRCYRLNGEINQGSIRRKFDVQADLSPCFIS